ncbi:hypothetical protein, partial [Paraburkholderia humisilvae]
WAVSTVNQWTQLALLSIRALCADKFALTDKLLSLVEHAILTFLALRCVARAKGKGTSQGLGAR